MNFTIEFSIFKLVWEPTFILNKQFFFGSYLPKEGVSDPKQDKWTWPSNSAYLNLSITPYRIYFPCFSIVFIKLKGNGVRLLSLEDESTSCLTS